MNIKTNIGNNIVKCLPYNGYINKNFEEINLTKLSNNIPFISKRNIVLIKLDIEGSEANAIYGGIELITFIESKLLKLVKLLNIMYLLFF